MPSQQKRKKSIRQKLNARVEFKNKNVLIVDDSIVRGTTSKEIVQMAMQALIKFFTCSSSCSFSHVYGINMPNRDELISHNRTISEIAVNLN